MKQRGFTIVELLVVIVVIAILATISVVAYSGIQHRARDAQRLHDMNTIAKALEIYKLQTGEYPVANDNSTFGWEISSVNPDNFLNDLKTSGVMPKVPVDPVNTGNYNQSTSRIYAYYRYPAGHGGCDASRGPFYILLAVWDGESIWRSPSAPGFSCPSQVWDEGFWSSGSFTY